jgi:hypothetical protein
MPTLQVGKSFFKILVLVIKNPLACCMGVLVVGVLNKNSLTNSQKKEI